MSTYDVLMEVETETLTEDAYKVDEFAGNVTLLVEAQVLSPVSHDTHVSLARLSHYTHLKPHKGAATMRRPVTEPDKGRVSGG